MSAHWQMPPSGLPSLDAARFSHPQRVTPMLPLGDRVGLAELDNLDFPHEGYDVTVPAQADHVLVMILAAATEGWHARLAGRPTRVTAAPDMFILLPAASDSRWQGTQGANRLVHLHLRPAWLAEQAEEAGLPAAAADLPLRLGFEDERLAWLVRRIRVAMQAGTPLDRLLGEQAASLAALEVLRSFGAGPPPARHRISPARLRAVREHIEARLGEALGLSELAAVARLSRFHFARAFRAETGESPHAYVTRRRCERAKALMLEGDLPLAEIAAICGFSHQAHFTTAFRRTIGVTPGRWRGERRA